MLELFLPIDPADIPSAQQKGAMVRNGRIMFYEKTRVKQARQAIVQALLTCSNGQRINNLTAYGVLIEYVYKPKTLKRSEQGTDKVTRPDLDNISKIMLDAITDSHIAWEDDSQASTIVYRKRFAEEGEEAHTHIMFMELAFLRFKNKI
jgi:Holliday junction resolvase RusA-like endonuclease